MELILNQLNQVGLPTGLHAERLFGVFQTERRVAAVESVPNARRQADGLQPREDLSAVHAADAAGQLRGRGGGRLLVLCVHHGL